MSDTKEQEMSAKEFVENLGGVLFAIAIAFLVFRLTRRWEAAILAGYFARRFDILVDRTGGKGQ